MRALVRIEATVRVNRYRFCHVVFMRENKFVYSLNKTGMVKDGHTRAYLMYLSKHTGEYSCHTHSHA